MRQGRGHNTYTNLLSNYIRDLPLKGKHCTVEEPASGKRPKLKLSGSGYVMIWGSRVKFKQDFVIMSRSLIQVQVRQCTDTQWRITYRFLWWNSVTSLTGHNIRSLPVRVTLTRQGGGGGGVKLQKFQEEVPPPPPLFLAWVWCTHLDRLDRQCLFLFFFLFLAAAGSWRRLGAGLGLVLAVFTTAPCNEQQQQQQNAG